MADIVFRQAPPAVEEAKPTLPEPEVDKGKVTSGESEDEPVELRDTGGRSVVLDALGIEDNVNSLPEEDKGKLNEVKNYILGIIEAKSISPTVSSFKKTLDDIKGDMGLASEADPAIVLDRIAGVVKAWRNISFIKDPAEKRRIFMKLAKLKSSTEMNKEVFKLMEGYQVWQ